MKLIEVLVDKIRLDEFKYIDHSCLKLRGGDKWSKVFGIFDGDRMVAISCLSKYYKRYVLENTEVLEDYRGRGLQRKLIEHRLEYVPQKAEVEVWVDGEFSLANINFMKDVHPEYRWSIFEA